MSGEPPVFGKNGAVLNSSTMTDDWREAHATGTNLDIKRNYKESLIFVAKFLPASIALIYMLNILADQTPMYVKILASIGAMTVCLIVMDFIISCSRHLVRSAARKHIG